MNRNVAPVLLIIAVFVVGACGSSPKDDPILRLSAEESLDAGRELFDAGKYTLARPYFQHAFEVEPNCAVGRESLLLVADSAFHEGGRTELVQAEAKYRDFLNRFPTSDQAAYAQYQIANSLAARVEKANRDQSSTFKALQAYQELARLYPTSEYAVETEAKIQEVTDRLADHEFVVGDFYLRYRYPAAAAGRFEELLDRFPEYTERDKVLYHLGVAYSRSRNFDLYAKAEPTFDRLRDEYPASDWTDRIPDRLPDAPPRRGGDEEPDKTDSASSPADVQEATREVGDQL